MVGTSRLALALVLTAIPVTLQGQSVRGQLTDSITKSPLAGAFLTLVDEKGAERARTITNTAGEFVLTAPAAGAYRIRSKRIGFRPYVSSPLALRAGEMSAFNAAIDPIPVPLASVVVQGERQCDVIGGSGAASVAAVWEEVREALAAVAWTSRLPNYWYDIAHFTREVSPSGRRQAVDADSTWREIGYQRVPIKSVPAEDLEVNGFVVSEADGATYRGPDADVLMSPPFLRTHCFETTAGKDETAGLIGLAFTPARGRRLADIQGTLWIDKKTAELRQIDYTYTHLPDDLVAPRAGGQIELLRLPSGTWIVSNWVIRMPRMVMKQRAMAMGTQLEVTGYRETGGNLVEVKTSTGAIVYRSDSLTTALAAVTAPSPTAAAPVIPSAPAPPPAPAVAPAPAPTAGVDSTAAAAPPVRKRTGARNPNLIVQDEVLNSTATDAYALIQELRPNWLRSRGAISINDPTAGNVQVYLDGERYGELDKLREIARRDVRQVRYYGAGEAQMRFGLGHAGGVIDVATGAIAPATPIASAPAPAPNPAPEPPATPVPSSPPTADTVVIAPTANRRHLAINQNVLTPEEFEGTTYVDVYSLIQHYRPNWLLRNRGPVSIYNQSAGDTRVYLNGVSAGDIGRLRDFRVADIRELRLLSAGDAQQRYGSGNAGGAIEVWTK